jgi:ATP-dependent Lhr-like helicase
VLSGEKVPRVPGTRVAFRDGIPVAVSAGGAVAFLADLDEQSRRDAEAALRRLIVPAAEIGHVIELS